MTLETEVKDWLLNNPMDADNREDLVQWCTEHFGRTDDDAFFNACWQYAREHSMLPK